MIRDTEIVALLLKRFSAGDPLKRDAATVLLDLCRNGMSDREIAEALESAAPELPPALRREIRAVAGESGISLPEDCPVKQG